MEDPISKAANQMATAVARAEDAAVRSILDSFHGPNNWTAEEALTHARVARMPLFRCVFFHSRRWFLFWDEVPLAEVRTSVKTHKEGPNLKIVATNEIKSATGRMMPWPGKEAG
jgi:hypothetical protein